MAKRSKKKPHRTSKRGIKKTAPAPFTPEEQISILLAADSITPRRVIGESVGLTEKQFTDKLKATGEFEATFRKALGNAKIKLVRVAHDKATEGDKTMLIFLLKCRCGFREADEDAMDTEEKARAIREGLDKMNGTLSQFQAPDGAFKKPAGVK